MTRTRRLIAMFLATFLIGTSLPVTAQSISDSIHTVSVQETDAQNSKNTATQESPATESNNTVKPETIPTEGEANHTEDETDAAKDDTDTAKDETDAEKDETDTAKDDTDTAKDDTDTAKDETDAEKDETDTAKEETDAEKDETDTAKEETDTVKDDADAVKDDADTAKDETDAEKGDADTAKGDSQSNSNPIDLTLLSANELVEVLSLQPLTDIYATVELRTLPFDQLSISVKDLTALINDTISVEANKIKPTDILVIPSIDGGRAVVLKQEDHLSMEWLESSLEIIAGSAKQLDTTNRRYSLNFNRHGMLNYYEIQDGPYGYHGFNIHVYNQKDSQRTELNSYIYAYVSITEDDNKFKGTNVGVGRNLNVDITQPQFISFSSPWWHNYDITAYEGLHTSEPNSGAINGLLDADMTQLNAGYQTRLDGKGKIFTLFFKYKGKPVGKLKYSVQLIEAGTIFDLVPPTIYKGNATGERLYAIETGDYNSQANTSPFTCESRVQLKENMKTTDTFFVSLGDQVDAQGYWRGTYKLDTDISKAVVGHFNTLETAADATDIKEQLFEKNTYSTGGYETTLKDPLKLTVFTNNSVNHFTVTAMDGMVSGSTIDNYLSFTGADGVSSTNIYKILKRDDSGAQQFGYEVMLIDDPNVDLTKLKPTFETNSGAKAYVNGVEQTSGSHEHNFSQGSIQYTANTSGEAGSIQKNYFVTYAKAVNSGAKLFVVVDGNEPNKREIFFDGYAGYNHDIFIANIGNASLTGLNVELQNPSNVALDDYWKVGGEGNETLSAFTEASSNRNGYASNVAKIRLNSTSDSGKVSGTLVITADGQEAYTITLSGEAGDPIITTSSLKDAVKYVPYQMLLQTNNRYQWNRTSFSLYSGILPDGVELLRSGELYGVPTKAGRYTFTVELKNSDWSFSNNRKEFTLTVLENTDGNVASQVDTGYEITTYVPRTLTEVKEYDFVSEGTYDHFVDFWLDGVKQTRDVDYTVKEGSTVITVLAQTFTDSGYGTHTIAAEFKNGDVVNRAAQNYTLPSPYTPPLTNPTSDALISGTTSSDESDESNSSNLGGGTLGGTRRVQSAFTSAITSFQNTLTRIFTRIKNQTEFKLAQLQQIAADAQKQGKVSQLNVDSMHPTKNEVDVRISIDPALATGDMNLGASTSSKAANRTRKLFQRFFTNEIIAALAMEQEGGFAQTVEICVRIPEGLKLEEIMVYTYNKDTNKYSKLHDPKMWLDGNRYLHFRTDKTLDIVVSNGVLQLKGIFTS